MEKENKRGRHPNCLANLKSRKGKKNKISRDMAGAIKHVWEELQLDPNPKQKTSLLELAKEDPWRFYELVKGMLPKDIFISGEMRLGKMSPEEIEIELRSLIEIASGLEEESDTSSESEK